MKNNRYKTNDTKSTGTISKVINGNIIVTIPKTLLKKSNFNLNENYISYSNNQINEQDNPNAINIITAVKSYLAECKNTYMNTNSPHFTEKNQQRLKSVLIRYFNKYHYSFEELTQHLVFILFY